MWRIIGRMAPMERLVRGAPGIMSVLIVARSNTEWERVRLGMGRGHVFVPTMGALHAGHAVLVNRGVKEARERGLAGCTVSIFVNPTQFNEKSDYDRYPRTIDADLAVCEKAGAAAVFVPRAEDVYPAGVDIRVPRLPGVATRPGLEDARRPGHFAGVCQVVARLFELVQPAAAVFGEKDWQQLAVVRAMVAQEAMKIEIIGAPTVRECDGLAMSSRNRFLAADDRLRALAISRALCAACGENAPDNAEAAMRRVLQDAGVEPEYAVVRDAATLERPEIGRSVDSVRWRALIAARVGSVRLIDNCAWGSTVAR